ncbi:MAG: hypothetical protein ACQEQF_00405 [Bacillota bacterium]
MSWYSNMLNQKLTYWGTSGFDKFSNPNIKSPVILNCRWEDKKELYKDAEGNEKVSEAVIFVNQILSAEEYIQEGEHSGTDISNAYEIKKVDKIPSIKGDKYQYKVLL